MTYREPGESFAQEKLYRKDGLRMVLDVLQPFDVEDTAYILRAAAALYGIDPPAEHPDEDE